MPIGEEYLSMWLVINYIGQCAQLCPVYIARLFNDVSFVMKLQSIVSEIVRWRLNTSLYDMWAIADAAEWFTPATVSMHCSTVRSYVCFMNELAKTDKDKRLTVHFSALALLHVARKISRNGFNDESMDILAAIFGHNVTECYRVLSELNTSELVDFLLKSAVEHVTTYRQLMARDFGSVVAIVTTDYEAMYAYKRGDYQRCLQLSTHNVHTLLYACNFHRVAICLDFTHLLDDDIVSLTALTVFVTLKREHQTWGVFITQLTLSLYLMTQSQLKLHHSVTSLAQTLHYIKVTQRRHPRECTGDQLTLKLAQRKIDMMQRGR